VIEPIFYGRIENRRGMNDEAGNVKKGARGERLHIGCLSQTLLMCPADFDIIDHHQMRALKPCRVKRERIGTHKQAALLDEKGAIIASREMMPCNLDEASRGKVLVISSQIDISEKPASKRVGCGWHIFIGRRGNQQRWRRNKMGKCVLKRIS
jgi:hypothetical protein